MSMSSILLNVSSAYAKVLQLSDDRLDEYWLMQSPLQSLSLTFAYLLIIFVGKKLMKNRRPLELKTLMIVYNFGMVLLSAFIFYEFLMAGWLTGYTLGCQMPDPSRSAKALRMVRICWLFHFSKYIEFTDSFFFLFRKKFSHLSFLHVFHHGAMPFSWWLGIKLYPCGGIGTFHGMLNSLVHTVMYTYYALSALGPQVQPYLWWKKYITTMQLTQFFVVSVHTSQFILFNTTCPYPKPIIYAVLFYAVFFFFLFLNFWRKAYVIQAPKTSSALHPGTHKQHLGLTKEQVNVDKNRNHDSFEHFNNGSVPTNGTFNGSDDTVRQRSHYVTR